jgi:hypothetical protein
LLRLCHQELLVAEEYVAERCAVVGKLPQHGRWHH